jgi:hypothetical protein
MVVNKVIEHGYCLRKFEVQIKISVIDWSGTVILIPLVLLIICTRNELKPHAVAKVRNVPILLLKV